VPLSVGCNSQRTTVFTCAPNWPPKSAQEGVADRLQRIRQWPQRDDPGHRNRCSATFRRRVSRTDNACNGNSAPPLDRPTTSPPARARLGARLLTAEIVIFEFLYWIPPHLYRGLNNHLNGAGNAISVALAGASWVVSNSICQAVKRALSHRIRQRSQYRRLRGKRSFTPYWLHSLPCRSPSSSKNSASRSRSASREYCA